MATDINIVALYETLLQQHKAIRDVKLEIESLKSMMFEHRPPFVEEFARHRDKVLGSTTLANIDGEITRLEHALAQLREAWK